MFTSPQLQYYSLKSIQQALDFPEPPSLSWVRHSLIKSRVSRRRFSQTKVCPKLSNDLSSLIHTFHEIIKNLPNNEIVCIGETGFLNIGNTVYGYFNKGDSPKMITVPKRRRLSVVMSILPSGIVSYNHQSKPFNTETFYRYIQMLLPCLPQHVKVLLMDNVAFHKSKKLRELVEENNLQILFIPPYSPRCNPIEEVFSLIKRRYRETNPTLPLDKNVFESINHMKNMEFNGFYNHNRRYLQDSRI